MTTLSVSTPSHQWAVLFLRDLWHLEIVGHVPRCDPMPAFGVPMRSPSASDQALLERFWQSHLNGRILDEANASVDDVFILIRELEQVDAWRDWSHAAKHAVEELAVPLSTSPSWSVREDCAEHSPPIMHIAVLPVADGYSAREGTLLYVALSVYSDVEKLRAAIRAVS